MRKMSTRHYHNSQGIHFLGPVQRTAVGAMTILSILAGAAIPVTTKVLTYQRAKSRLVSH